MDTIEELTRRVIAYRDARDWKQFHNPKDVSISLVLEATEVMEHFHWKNKEEVEQYVKEHKEAIGEELADVLHNVLLLAYDLGIDIPTVFEKKMKQNEKKYPLEKAKGRHGKYTEY